MNAFAVPASDLSAILPEALLAAAGCVILMLEAFLPKARRGFTQIALLATVVAAWLLWTRVPSGSHFNGALESSALTTFFSLLVLAAAALSLAGTDRYLRREKLLQGEYHALFLWSVTGVLLLVRATDLLTIFLALELLSICLYALAGFNRKLAQSTEAALKYFLMGAFVSGFVLLGIALVYGESGATQISAITEALGAGQGSLQLLTLGFVLLISGFAFKMSLVPFHAWAPDVYQGAPTPFAAFLSVAPKAASAVVILRLLQALTDAATPGKWTGLIAFLAVGSMLAGNLLGLVQRDLRRLLAYSGIAHMGYLLLAFLHVDAESWSAAAVYLAAYALMNGGAFLIVSELFERTGDAHLLSDLAGWGYRKPVLSACLTVLLLSLGGIPPTLGFLGKYLVFSHAIRTGHVGLAIVGVLASLVGVFYYLRVVYFLYMKPEVREPEAVAPTRLLDWGGTVAVGLAALAVLLMGLLPARLLAWLAQAIAPLG
jgi:NADH-quinone oxidoreductase subunit N